MWASDRTKNNLAGCHSIIAEENGCGYEGRYKAALITCLMEIAKNLADISDSLSEQNGYDLSEK